MQSWIKKPSSSFACSTVWKTTTIIRYSKNSASLLCVVRKCSTVAQSSFFTKTSAWEMLSHLRSLLMKTQGLALSARIRAWQRYSRTKSVNVSCRSRTRPRTSRLILTSWRIRLGTSLPKPLQRRSKTPLSELRRKGFENSSTKTTCEKSTKRRTSWVLLAVRPPASLSSKVWGCGLVLKPAPCKSRNHRRSRNSGLNRLRALTLIKMSLKRGLNNSISASMNWSLSSEACSPCIKDSLSASSILM